MLIFGMSVTLSYLHSDEVLSTIESGEDFEKTHPRHLPAALHARGNRRCVPHAAGRDG